MAPLRPSFVCVWLLAVGGWAFGSPAAVRGGDADVVEMIRAGRLARLLTDLGLKFEELTDSEDEFLVTVPCEDVDDGLVMVLYNRGKSLHLSGRFSSSGLTPERANQWNLDHYFSRALLLEDDLAVIEFDLGLTGGVSESAIKAWIRKFCVSLEAFHHFVRDPPPTAP